MTTCKLRIHGLHLSWTCSSHKFSYLWLWDSSQRFCCSLNVLYATTETTIKFLMWILILIALCVCLKVQTSQISQKTQHTTQQRPLKCSKGFSFYTRIETLNSTRHMGLGWIWNFAEFSGLWFSIDQALFSIDRALQFYIVNSSKTLDSNLHLNKLWASLNLDSLFWSWFANI